MQPTSIGGFKPIEASSSSSAAEASFSDATSPSSLSINRPSFSDSSQDASWTELSQPLFPRSRLVSSVLALILYGLYRAGGCNLSKWECSVKSPRRHLYDITALLGLCEFLRTTMPSRATVPTSARRSTPIAETVRGIVHLITQPATIATAVRAALPSLQELHRFLWRLLWPTTALATAIVSMFVFGALGEEKPLQTSLSSGANFPPASIAAFVIALLVTLLLMIANLRETRRAGGRVELIKTIFSGGSSFVYIAICAILATKITPPQTKDACAATLHIHHWLLAFGLAASMRHFKGRLGRVAALAKCAVLGIFIEGVSAFGPAGPLSSGLCKK
jgi:hypothetical protein